MIRPVIAGRTVMVTVNTQLGEQVQGYFLGTLMRGQTKLSVYPLLRQDTISLYKHTSEVAFSEQLVCALPPLLCVGKRYIFFLLIHNAQLKLVGLNQTAAVEHPVFLLSFLPTKIF